MYNENVNFTGEGENLSPEMAEELFQKEIPQEEINPITILEEKEEPYETKLGIQGFIENSRDKLKEKFQKQIENDIDHTIAGECAGCARCCQAILPVSKKEIQKIKSYIGVKKIQPINRHTMLDTEFINICPFLSFENKCMIYPVRPEVCKRFLCSHYKDKSAKYFNHTDKIIVNFYNEFLKNQSYPCPETNILKLNASYTAQKSKLAGVYFKRKGK